MAASMSTSMFIKEEEKVMSSDLLFYLQNKLQSIPHDDILKICDNFYHDDDYV